MFTPKEHKDNLIEASFHRESEVYHYQVNIDNYALMLEALPKGEWPEDIAQYKDADIAKLPTDMTDATVQRITDHQYRDRLRQLLRTERAEQSKSKRIRDAMKTQIGASYDADIAVLKAAFKAAPK